AMYYGAKEGITEPGTDCPKGTNPEIDWIKVLTDAGYSLSEAKWLRDPANPTRNPNHGQNQMAFRGKDRANVYTDPTSTPDPGLVGVTGKIAEGINLDGNTRNGFTSPTGEKGIDNEFYRTLGCWKTYRAPARLSSGALTFNDTMRNGSWTTLIVVTGKGDDPMNDKSVRVGFYFSSDKMVKDGNGEIARDYTFRIKPHAKYEAIFDARTKDGVIVSTAPSDVTIRDAAYTNDLELLRGQIKLTMQPDGSLKGYLGGYRPWEHVYKGWVNARGPVIESLTWVQLPSVYYALKRNADFSPTPGGEKTHISYAMRIEALPAFVMTPDASGEVTEVVSYKAQANPDTARPQVMSVLAAGGVIPDRTAKVQAGPTTPLNVPAGYGSAGGQ
ncbi:MAG TPA: hypothetical protein VFV70_01185, partial [Hyphomonadaceae bacterium]|nr:hypothetical protein [Hyphomonadaceae bacterium]